MCAYGHDGVESVHHWLPLSSVHGNSSLLVSFRVFRMLKLINWGDCVVPRSEKPTLSRRLKLAVTKAGSGRPLAPSVDGVGLSSWQKLARFSTLRYYQGMLPPRTQYISAWQCQFCHATRQISANFAAGRNLAARSDFCVGIFVQIFRRIRYACRNRCN